MGERRILLGVVGRPHGVRGLVHVHSYADADLASYSPLLDERGREWTLVWRGDGIAELRDAAGLALPDRTAAERLVNAKLHVERERLPATEADDFYLSDLVGLEAVGEDAAVLGRVVQVHDYGAGASVEIVGQGAALIVPFTRACVPEVDLAAGRLTVVPPVEVEEPTLTQPSPASGRGLSDGGVSA